MDIFVPELIRRKRDGGSLSRGEIEALIAGYTDGVLPDYQMAALLMAVFFHGLGGDELSAWTGAMLHSGTILDYSALSGKKVDKHSTGGVGDKISLPLAAAVAACGVKVPMISGRGLGHTGGTLDKLEAIPGFRTDIPEAQMATMLDEIGLFLVGQTATLAPADRKIYALRDVTGTVESIPLIASSIMSKKLAEGIGALVLDVKVGRGAFMTGLDRARELAQTLMAIGENAGVQVRALITDMESPIGTAVGNALEVVESIAVMTGGGPADTVELTVELGAEMLVLGGIAQDLGEGRQQITASLGDGSALEVFRRVIAAQGGDPGVCDDLGRLPMAKERQELTAPHAGVVTAIDPRAVAQAAIEVGAGRRVKEDAVDPATGVVLKVRLGEKVSARQPLAELHHNGAGVAAGAQALSTAFTISSEEAAAPLASRILERL